MNSLPLVQVLGDSRHAEEVVEVPLSSDLKREVFLAGVKAVVVDF